MSVVFALLLPLIIGGGAFGVETSYWYLKDLQLQSAADAAAYAGAIEKRSGSPSGAVTEAATASAVANGFDPGIGTIAVNSPPTSGAYTTSQAVEVIIEQPVQRFFTRIFLSEDITERARAVVRFESTGKACILALDPSASKAVLFSGNTTVNIRGCNVMANSIASDAVRTQGSARANVDCIISGGGVALTKGTTQTTAGCPVLRAPSVADPFEYLPVPTNTNAAETTKSTNYTPGRFVYTSGLGLKGNVDLQPGTYIISGGTLSVNAGANVTCSACVKGAGITFYLSGSARVSMNGNATVKLQAPTTGTYAGILFFGDSSNSGGSSNRFNGTASSQLTGTFYFKSQAVEYLGNFSGKDGCTTIVAGTIAWSGNTTIN